MIAATPAKRGIVIDRNTLVPASVLIAACMTVLSAYAMYRNAKDAIREENIATREIFRTEIGKVRGDIVQLNERLNLQERFAEQWVSKDQIKILFQELKSENPTVAVPDPWEVFNRQNR